MQKFEQDDNVYEFPDDCVVMPDFDKQPFFTKLAGTQAIQAKGCDIIAVLDNEDLYLIEAKDYSHKNPVKNHPKASDLAKTIARKSFDTLACLVIGTKQSTNESVVEFCHKALACTRIIVCATVELSRTGNLTEIDSRYLTELKECLRRETKGLLQTDRDIMVTWNNNIQQRKFWTSHWSLTHD